MALRHSCLRYAALVKLLLYANSYQPFRRVIRDSKVPRRHVSVAGNFWPIDSKLISVGRGEFKADCKRAVSAGRTFADDGVPSQQCHAGLDQRPIVLILNAATHDEGIPVCGPSVSFGPH